MSINIDDVFGKGAFNFDLANPPTNKKKKKSKGGFDDIFSLAGIGNQPFAGFKKRESQGLPLGDFANPIKRKRRSREAIALGVRDTDSFGEPNAIFGGQFFGNAVGGSEKFLTSKKTRAKFSTDKRRVKELVGTEFGRFETMEETVDVLDSHGRKRGTRKTGRRIIASDPFGNKKKSNQVEDTVMFGRGFSPRTKDLIRKVKTKRALRKLQKPNSPFGSATPSGLFSQNQINPQTRLGQIKSLAKVTGSRGTQRKRIIEGSYINKRGDFVEGTSKIVEVESARTPSKSTYNKEETDRQYVAKLDKDNKIFQAKQDEQNIFNEEEKKKKKQQQTKKVVNDVLNPKLVNILSNISPQATGNVGEREILTIDGSRKLKITKIKREQKPEKSFIGPSTYQDERPSLLAGLPDIVDKLNKKEKDKQEADELMSVDARSQPVLGSLLDVSPAGSQAQTRIAKSKKATKKEADISGFFGNVDNSLKQPTTFADDDVAFDTKLADPSAYSSKPVNDSKNILDTLKQERPVVKSKDVEGDFGNDAISDEEFDDLGGQGLLPEEAQDFFDKKKKGERSFGALIDTSQTGLFDNNKKETFHDKQLQQLYPDEKRPQVKKGTVYSKDELLKGESPDEYISDKDFVEMGDLGSLPPKVQSQFDKRSNAQTHKSKKKHDKEEFMGIRNEGGDAQSLSFRSDEEQRVRAKPRKTMEDKQFLIKQEFNRLEQIPTVREFNVGLLEDREREIERKNKSIKTKRRGKSVSNVEKRLQLLGDEERAGTSIDDLIEQEERNAEEQQESATVDTGVFLTQRRNDSNNANVIDPNRKTASGKQSQQKFTPNTNMVKGQFVPSKALSDRANKAEETREVIAGLKAMKNMKGQRTTETNKGIGVDNIIQDINVSNNLGIGFSEEYARINNKHKMNKAIRTKDTDPSAKADYEEALGVDEFLDSQGGQDFIKKKKEQRTQKQNQFENEMARAKGTPNITQKLKEEDDMFGIPKQNNLTEKQKDEAGIIDDFGDIMDVAKNNSSQPSTNKFEEYRSNPTLRKGGDGINPLKDQRKGNTGVKAIDFIDEVTKGRDEAGNVKTNSPKGNIQDPIYDNKIDDAVRSGRISEKDVDDAMIVTDDKDIPKSTRNRNKRDLRDLREEIQESKGEITKSEPISEPVSSAPVPPPVEPVEDTQIPVTDEVEYENKE